MPPPRAVALRIASLVHDQRALSFLANALASVAETLVDDDFVRDLLSDLADEMDEYPDSRWADALWRLCSGIAKRRRPNGYVRGTKAAPFEDTGVKTWTNIVSATVWNDCHFAGTVLRFPTPPFPAQRGEAFRRQFRALITRPDWFKVPTRNGGAWLGRPAIRPANCWISSIELDEPIPRRAKDVNGPARRVVEALGLYPESPLVSYVRYTIDAEMLPDQGDGAKRPSAADGGNEWFRIVGPSAWARRYAEQGWGCTVNLAALRAGEADDAGRPERVTPSIRLDMGYICAIEVIFPVAPRTCFRSKPTGAFAASLLANRTAIDIEREVVALWNQ